MPNTLKVAACAAPFAIAQRRNRCVASSAIARCAASTPEHLRWHLSTLRNHPSCGFSRNRFGIAPPLSRNALFARSAGAPSGCVKKFLPTGFRFALAAWMNRAASKSKITSGHRLKCIGSTLKTHYRAFQEAVLLSPPKQRDNICKNFNSTFTLPARACCFQDRCMR